MTRSMTHEPGFRHEAFFYGDADEFLAGTVPFVRAGLEADEAILVAMPRPSLALLEGALDAEGERVQFADMEQLGRNPARIIPAWRDFLDQHAGDGRGVRGVGEPVWASRSAAELDECRRHEALLNLAFEGAPAWSLICPYDTSRLDDGVLEGARHSHPLVSERDCVVASDSYAGVPSGSDTFAGQLESPGADVALMPFTIEALGDARRFVAAQARARGLGSSRVADLVLAAHELATNSLQHGEGKGSIRIWHEDGAVVCEVDSEGRIEQPLAGRERPRRGQPRGRGLWLANQLCDLVQIRSADSGSVVRLRMSLDGY